MDKTWAVQLDWLNILQKLGIDSINEIPEYKREKAIKNISKLYEPEDLLEFTPDELDELVADELRELMKKELSLKQREKDKLQEQFKNKIIPLKHGGIIKINPQDIKDLDLDGDPEDIIKYFYKKFFGKDKDDDKEDKDKFKEDNTGYYI